MDQNKIIPVEERGTVTPNSTSKKTSKYFPLLFTDFNTSDLLVVLVVFFVSQQTPNYLNKTQLRNTTCSHFQAFLFVRAMSYLHVILRTRGSLSSKDKAQEAFLSDLDSLAMECETHQATGVQRPISQYIDKNGTKKLPELLSSLHVIFSNSDGQMLNGNIF